MNIKEILVSSIKKCFLDLTGVGDYYIFWLVENGRLKLTSYVIAHKSSTLSKIEVADFYLPDSLAVVRDPARLLKLLNIAGDTLSVSLEDNKMKLLDSNFDMEFVLADPNTIGVRVPDIEEPISYELTIDLTDDFVNRYVLAKSANNTEIVSVEVKDREARFELGEANGYTNKIKFSVTLDGIFNMERLLFSSDIIEEILKRNKGTQGKLYVCEDGLMKIEYNDGTIKSTYFLVALDKL
jgi:hypothetical protein